MLKKNICIRQSKKLNKTLERQLNIGCDKLIMRLEDYRKQNIDVSRIFNDDILIHDIIHKNFYVYKCSVEGMQLRILYQVVNNDVNILAFYSKNSSNRNKNACKEYIHYFEDVVERKLYAC